MESDARFKHVAFDPRFKGIPKRVRKVQIDKRFSSMFSDERFKVKYTVDKRGRKVNETSNEGLRKYYRLADEDCEEEKEAIVSKDSKNKSKAGESGDDCKMERRWSVEEEEEEDESDGCSVGGRNEDVESDGEMSDSDTSDGESVSSTDVEEFDPENDDQIVHDWGDMATETPLSENTTRRLAVCNLNWDRISANDLFVLFSSFKPQGSVVESVSVYPSDYGREQLEKEEVEGPVGLNLDQEQHEEQEGTVAATAASGSIEGSEYSREKLRRYQMNRLKYYYAVVECDTKETAESIYQQCDGIEYELSGTRIDLRFVPDDMTFDDREPKSQATGDFDFQPNTEFIDSALKQSKVDLTWDETDPLRTKAMERKFTNDDLHSMDFSAYLASPSSEEEGEGEGERVEGGKGTTLDEKIQKYRDLLQDGGSLEKNEQEMEVVWEPGVSAAEVLVQKKKSEKELENLTPWEKYLREKKEQRRLKKKKKKEGEKDDEGEGEGDGGEGEGEGEGEGGGSSKENKQEDLGFDDPFFQHDVTVTTAQSKKKKKKSLLTKNPLEDDEQTQKEKSELELLVMGDNGDGVAGKKHFSLSSILGEQKKKRKKKKAKQTVDKSIMGENDFTVDINDERFSALYDSHYYAPDPTDPQYKPTRGMAALMAERQRRRKLKGKETLGHSEPSVHSLVSTVKSKVKSFKCKRLHRAKKPRMA